MKLAVWFMTRHGRLVKGIVNTGTAAFILRVYVVMATTVSN